MLYAPANKYLIALAQLAGIGLSVFIIICLAIWLYNQDRDGELPEDI